MIDFRARIETAVSQKITSMTPLSGGCVGQVMRVGLENGRFVVAKMAAGEQGRLNTEGEMLTYLAAHSALPVPTVLHQAPDLLIMEFVAGESRFSPDAERDAAERLAALHAISAPQFGFEQETLIGGLPQPNPWTDSWIDFFREQRLRYMAQRAVAVNRLPLSFMPRIDDLCEQLGRWLVEPERPSLLHGDVWTTNVLAQNGNVTAFLDPAIYYGHPEIELAFITLFGTFGDAFFKHYHSLRSIPAGFLEHRRDLYNLYPLLVHVRLFGGSYVRSVDGILRKYDV